MKVKWYKLMVWILIVIVVLFFLLTIWYRNNYSMDAVMTYSVYSQTFDKKLLIATQGSTFKDSLVQNVVRYYENDSVFIKVIDVSTLPAVNPTDFNATLILHTWEYGKAPKGVVAFVEKNREHLEKVGVFATSGEGNNGIGGVDGLTGASLIKDVSLYTDRILLELDALLPREKNHAYFRETQYR